MAGIVIIVPYANYTPSYIGKISFTNIVDLESIDISFDGNSYIGEEFDVDCSYYPLNASKLQCHMKYSIINGSSYATINENTGLVTILPNANNSLVTIKAESTYDNSIYNTKNINVTYKSHTEYLYDITSLSYIGINNNLLQFTPTFDPIDTIHNNVSYSIISGNEYAYIGSSTGILEVLSTATDENNVIVRCISNYNQSIYKDLELKVTYYDYHKYYEELDYISSTQSGKQYIDLGCKLMENTDNIEIFIKFKIYYNGQNQTPILNSQYNVNPWPGFIIRNADNTYVEGFSKWQCTTTVASGKNNRYYFPGLNSNIINSVATEYCLVQDIHENHIIIDNIPSSQIMQMNTTLFCALTSSNDPILFAWADLYYLKIIKGNQVIRDLIPAKRKSDNAIGLYDKEHDYFYESQGDAPFVGTPKV